MPFSVSRFSTRKTLVYCSSISPQSGTAGELLIYRHFTKLNYYNLLLISPANKPPSEMPNMAGKVLVRRLSGLLGRLRRGWLFPFADRILAKQLMRNCRSLTLKCKPTVVVTVFAPDTYMTAAAAFAEKNHLPLVLFCHDDYEETTPRSFRPTFARIYRQAQVRLCVSKPMADEFLKRYGAAGTVLYPIPGDSPKPPLAQSAHARLRIGIAGSIGTGYEEAILRLAERLHSMDGKVVIASSSPRNAFPRIWSHPAVVDVGHVAPEEVKEVFLAAGVNILGVVQSFASSDERAFRFNFPSKLVEYSTYGLPLLIVAPATASAVTWAKDRGPVAAIATNLSAGLDEAISLLSHAEARHAFAQSFFEASADFSPERAQAILEDALRDAEISAHTAG